MKRIPHYKKISQAGFTLVELMVSLSLFVIVVLAAVSSLYTVNNSARKVTAMRTVLDNLNFAMESMSRTIRTGTEVVCGGSENNFGTNNCSFSGNIGADRLMVKSTLGAFENVEYRYNNVNGKGRIEKCIQDASGNCVDWLALTAPEIDVKNLQFFVDGADPTDEKQPSVIIFVEGIASTTTDVTAPFSIQTYLSQRAAE